MKVNIPQNTQTYTKKMPSGMRAAASYINLKEADGSLATVRLGQEMLTNWLPKAVFARGLVDFTEKTFLECTENVVVYILPVLVGTLASKLFTNKFFTKSLSETIKKGVTTTAEDLIKEGPDNKKLMPIKAAIATATLAIPLAEYSLSYVKNLFTLKLFKQADFNNIANLNKEKKEDVEKQKQVKASAKKHIKIAAGIYAGCLALAALFATKGKNSKALQSISEAILAPGSKFFKNNEKKAATINKYFGLDFANKGGKLAMSNGQITACVVVGGFGYFGAAKDRGKQDYKEVLYRFPLVGLYAITGSELLEKALRSHLKKQDKCKELFEAEANDEKIEKLANAKDATKEQIAAAKKKTSKLANFGDLAEKLAKEKFEAKGIKATAEQLEAEATIQFKNLLKQKSKIVLAPFIFSLGFMGFFVAGMSRYFTKYRYNKDLQNQTQKPNFSQFDKVEFAGFGKK